MFRPHPHPQQNQDQRVTARKLNISKSSVQRILKEDLKLKPYHEARTSRFTETHAASRLHRYIIDINVINGIRW